MTNTVMSKRYLRELVELGIVDGWDDPRMPTLCGLRRRGYTPSSIFTFVREAGIAKCDNLIDMRQLEACVRSELDLAAQRRVAVLHPVKLVVDNYPARQDRDFRPAQQPPTGTPTMIPPVRWCSAGRSGLRRRTSRRCRLPSSSG